MSRESLPTLDRKSIIASDRSGTSCAVSWHHIVVEAKLYWPRGTAKALMRITGCSRRTAYRWLNESNRPKANEVVAIVLALRAEYVARGRIFEQLDLKFD